ncbi:MAG: ParB/RepB/Spo0J family partition protein [Holophagaceae bacterium]|nr:ParB/RepB/Spo0J family partition protein [Holophagaceae bacterium]
MTAKRPALGRGLTSLMSQHAQQDVTPTEIPVGSLVPNRHQPRTRFDETTLENLAVSLKQHGMVQPIVVRKVGEKFEIIAGERRWRAAKSVGLPTVPVVIKDIQDDRLLEFALVENIQRQELNPIEEAKAYSQLGKLLQLTQEQVADRVGKSRPQVANMVRLLRLPLDVQDMVALEQISTGHAKVLLGLEKPQLQVQLANEVIEKQMSVRALENRIHQMSSFLTAKDKKTATQDVFIRDAAEKLTQTWATRVEIKPKGKGGSLVFHFASADDLIQLFEKLKLGPKAFRS